MRKIITQGFLPIILLLVTTSLNAQTPAYFFYDPACLQQMDYEKVNAIDDLAHMDYYSANLGSKQLIFRVQKDPANLNRKIVAEIPVKPYMCPNATNVPATLLREINNSRRLAYLVVQMGSEYALYNIHSIATLEHTPKGIKYTDATYGFEYDKTKSKTGEILNRGKNKERNIFFAQQKKTSCLPTYEFKIISRHIEKPIKHLTFVKHLGIERLYTAQGALQLVRVNGKNTSEAIAQLCSEVTIQNVQEPERSPVDQKLWASRRETGLTARSVTKQQDLPPRQTVPADLGEMPPPAAAVVDRSRELLPGGIYIVQEKESLYTISEKFNVSIERLVTINNLQGFELGLNQPLKVVDDGTIPSKSNNPLIEVTADGSSKVVLHIVQQGDTLYGISKRYGITLKEVYQFNPNLTSDAIDINQKIIVGYQSI